MQTHELGLALSYQEVINILVAEDENFGANIEFEAVEPSGDILDFKSKISNTEIALKVKEHLQKDTVFEINNVSVQAVVGGGIIFNIS